MTKYPFPINRLNTHFSVSEIVRVYIGIPILKPNALDEKTTEEMNDLFDTEKMFQKNHDISDEQLNEGYQIQSALLLDINLGEQEAKEVEGQFYLTKTQIRGWFDKKKLVCPEEFVPNEQSDILELDEKKQGESQKQAKPDELRNPRKMSLIINNNAGLITIRYPNTDDKRLEYKKIIGIGDDNKKLIEEFALKDNKEGLTIRELKNIFPNKNPEALKVAISNCNKFLKKNLKLYPDTKDNPIKKDHDQYINIFKELRYSKDIIDPIAHSTPIKKNDNKLLEESSEIHYTTGYEESDNINSQIESENDMSDWDDNLDPNY